MFNEEQKIRFIRSYTSSINTANVATNVFNGFESYESAWSADLCTRTADELQPIIDEILGLRSKSRWMTLSILKEYAKWCMMMKVPGACDGMLHIEVSGLDKIRKQMVSSPLHLQMYLDKVFVDESEETIDNIYRCYFWMAFGGISEEDTLFIKNSDVDLEQMLIRYNNTSAPIYREALPAFKNAMQLQSFVYLHPNYSESIRRDRVAGEELMRGIKAVTKTMTIRSSLSRRSAEAIKAGRTEQQLSFYRVWLSGLFYRIYERERAGVPVDFSEAAVSFMEGKTYVLCGREKIKHKQNRIERDYMEDYQRWKLAFSI